MAAAEARAVWQRAANRYLIQEDAKRAPKLSCCSSIESLMSKIDTKPMNPTDLDDSFPLPSDKSFYSSDSKWWIQLQPDFSYQRSLINEEFNRLEPRKSHQFVENQDESSVSSIKSFNFLSSKGSYEFVEMGSVEVPWWKMAEKDESGSSVSKKSHVLIESSDLYQPIHMGSEAQTILCGQNAFSRGEMQPDTSKMKILEALCHSQTRAREAEIAAKKAYAEREHAIKIVFRQASQLFAYRQWVYLLQLENLCYQVKNKKCDPMASVIPVLPSKNGKLDKNLKRVAPGKRKRTRMRRGFGLYGCGLREYAVVFVVGLGIVGAGLVLGWTVGWMLI